METGLLEPLLEAARDQRPPAHHQREQDTADKLGSRCLAAADAQESARTLLTRESSSF